MQQTHHGAGAQPDHAGLQVAYPSDHTLPEAVPVWQQQQQHQEGWKQGPYAYAAPTYDAGPEVAPPSGVAAAAAGASSARPWYRRKRWILTIAVALVVVIVGAVVGGVVGSRTTAKYVPSSSTTTPSDTTGGGSSPPANPQRTSVCRTSPLCPQILAAALEESNLASPYTAALHLFARGIDNSIWHTSAPVSSSSSPPSYTPFTSFLAGPFVSQPAALAWGNGSTGYPHRVGVFGISDPDRGVRMKTVQGNSSDVGGPVGGPLATCLVYGARADLWSVFASDLAHNFGSEKPAESDLFWSQGRSVQWQGSATFGTALKGGRPGVVCRWDEFVHDIVVYGEADGAVRHSSYSGPTGWTRPVNRGGKFQGEPVVVGVGTKRFDFFGIGEDRAMYHFMWTAGGGYTTLEKLGGQFASVPSAVVTGGDRIDVVALGMNDALQHRVMKGQTWAGDWEDLGIFANSAPLLVNVTLKSPAEERIAMFVVGEHGEVNQTMWTVSEDLSWKGLVWKSLGGNMTTEFLF